MSVKDIFKKASAADKARARKQAINKPNMHGTNLFFNAIEKGDLTLVRKMVEEGADIHALTTQRGMISSLMVSVPYEVGATPLHAACLLGAPDIADFLLEKGAKPNATDSQGHTPIDYAVLSFNYWQAEAERREKSYFSTQNKMQKSAERLHDFERVVSLLQEHNGKSGMFDVPDILRLSPLQAHIDSSRKPQPKLPRPKLP